jgi:hypothetical protein
MVEKAIAGNMTEHMTQVMPSSRALHLIDAAVAVWIAAWIALGVAIGVNVRQLTVLSNTVLANGRAVQTVGKSLQSLGGLPLIGDQVGKDATQVEAAGAAAANAGRSSASSIRALSVLLAVAVALLPSIPVLTFYLPARLVRRREAAALVRALREYGSDPDFHAFLARRAIEALGYHRLRRVSARPWADIENGHSLPLAQAELRRLGISPRLLDPGLRSRS